MQLVRCRAILFDMDGTLVDSTACVETIWGRWAARTGLDLEHVLAVSHGRRTVDAMQDLAPHLDVEQEVSAMDADELLAEEGIEAVRGAAELLRALPSDRWAVVTSAGRALAQMRLAAAGLPVPSTMVGAEDVANGKPSPEGYLLAATLLGEAPEQCLVVEDTPAGILAARSAGMQILAITSTYPASSLLGAPSIANFAQVEAYCSGEDLELRIT